MTPRKLHIPAKKNYYPLFSDAEKINCEKTPQNKNIKLK